MLRDDTVMFHFIGPMGVRVEVGQSLIFLVGLILFLSGGDLLYSLVFVSLLVLAILLHEMGHAWGNIVQGVPVRRIMLHGGGGFCESTRTATRRQQELIVAMGPLTNLALWALSSLGVWAIWEHGSYPPSEAMIYLSMGLSIFAFLNIALFFFNLIPVQPLDGGKLFHLFVLRFLTPAKAQRMTGAVGLVLSVAWIPAAVLFYVDYGFILFFFPSIPAHYRMARGQLA